MSEKEGAKYSISQLSGFRLKAEKTSVTITNSYWTTAEVAPGMSLTAAQEGSGYDNRHSQYRYHETLPSHLLPISAQYIIDTFENICFTQTIR